MTERATMTQLVQIGVEGTPGLAVATTKRLSATQFSMGPAVDIATYRGSGYKYPSVTALNKEWTEGTFSGPLTYTEIIYLLSGCVKTGSAAGTPSVWTFSPATTTEDTVTTYTIEQGDGVRAHEVNYGLITGITMTWNDSGAEVSGDFIGKAMTDGITMTAGNTEVALVPVTRIHTDVLLSDTTAGLASGTPLSRALSVEWSLTNRFAPIWVLNQDDTFPVHIETEPALQVKLMVEADAAGMALLDTMRANDTKFMRIESVGDLISGTVYYRLVVDTAFRVTDVAEFSDEDGVYAIEWTGTGVYDATWTKAFNITVTNSLTAL